MTRSAYQLSLITIALAALAFALPTYAYQNDHGRWDRDYDDRDDDRIPSCEITVSPNTVYYGGEVTLSWDSDYADQVEITDLGKVSREGSRRITVDDSKTYYMTTYNGSHSSECSTFVNILGDEYHGGSTYYRPYYPYYNYTAPYPTYTYTVPTHVNLTQIPYTGFDFGTVGNAIYWAALAVVAIGGAYILVYMQGFRALASLGLVTETVQAGRMQATAMRRMLSRKEASRATPAAPVVAAVVPVADETLTTSHFGKDTMQVVEGSQPRIVITRE